MCALFTFLLTSGLVVALTLPAPAQVLFNQANYPTNGTSYSVAIGDLNGDGHADLATANHNDNNVSVLLNDGTGVFGPPTQYPIGGRANSIAIGDLNNDGSPDLAVANVNDNVSVLLNNGDGSFAAHSTYNTGDHPFSVAIGDLNGDGHLDLASANINSGDVSVLLNNGDGTFAAQSTYAANGARLLALGDLDGDGHIDLAVAGSVSNNVSVLLNNGDGTFAAQTTYPAGEYAASVAVTDVDNDGFPDLAVANRNSDDLSVLLNNGDGTFAAQSVYNVGASPVSVAAGDLNGDNSPDLAVPNYPDNISVLLNNGDGTFAAQSVYNVGAVPQSVAAGDLNGDGRLDLVTANFSSENVSVLLNTVPTPGDPGNFITTWKTNNAGDSEDNQITIPIHQDGGYNFTIAWGDGNQTTWQDGDDPEELTHTYAAPGTYTVEITGDFPRIYFNGRGDRGKVLSIEQWGDIAWSSMEGAFNGASNLMGNATDVPDLSGVTSLAWMFQGASVFNGNIGSWDVSGVTNMSGMLTGANNFNQDIGSWNVLNVTNMDGMFVNAYAFNQDISSWQVQNVTNMNSMFRNAVEFSQDLSGWNVSKVTIMQRMLFNTSAFNVNIGNWDVSNVTDMFEMLSNSGLSPDNYDATLTGWAGQAVQSGITLGADGLEYCASASERQSLIADHGWTISGDMQSADCDGDLNPDANNVLYVDINVNTEADGYTGTGDSWANAVPELADALKWANLNQDPNWATTPLKIFVAKGTYKPLYSPEDGNFGNPASRDNAFLMVNNVQLYGGFDPANGIDDLNDTRIFATAGGNGSILSGDIGVGNDTTDNTYHVMLAMGEVGSARLNGFTITGGNADGIAGIIVNGEGSIDGYEGAGMHIRSSSPSIANCLFQNNNSANDGGGIYNIFSSSTVTITNSLFRNNTAQEGGGLFNSSSSLIISNSLFQNNTADIGGGMSNISSSSILTNVTLAGNTAFDGGGVYNEFGSSSTLANCIVWGNGEAIVNAPPINPDPPSSATVTYSIVEGGYTGTGNLNQNPNFADPANGDYSLQVGSPAIDAGTVDTTGLGLPAGDIAGGPRILGTAIDMGAWEGPLQVSITGAEGWRMMAAPAGGLSYAALLDTLWLQGIPGGDVTTGFPNLYTWDEQNQVFVPVANANDVPAAGQGFIVYVYDDQNYDGAPEGFPKILSLSEGRTGGGVSPPLSYTPFSETGAIDTLGFNLVGNPYGVSIDWDNPGWTKTGLAAPIYVWDHATGNYLSYNGTTGTGGFTEGLITPWQGFWVQATAAGPAIEFTEDVRSTGGVFYGAPGEGPTEPPAPQLRFTLKQEAEAAASGGRSSQAVVMFDGAAEPGKDRLDAWKLASLSGDYLHLYTTSSEGYALDINALPSFADSLQPALEVAMGLEGSALGGAYTLSWSLQAMPEEWSVTLTDLYTNMEVELGQTGEYEFSMESGQQVEATSEVASTLAKPGGGVVPTVLKGKAKNHRFTLRVGPAGETNRELPAEISISAAYPNPFARRCSVDLALPEQAHVRVGVYDVLGRKITTVVDRQMEPGYATITMDAEAMGVASGVYLCRIQIGDHTETTKMTFIK